MYITITKEDVEKMTGLVPNDVELDDIVVRLEAAYRDRLWASSLASIAEQVVSEHDSLARKRLQACSCEELNTALHVATYEDIAVAIADVLKSVPDETLDRVMEQLPWEELIDACVRELMYADHHELLKHTVGQFVYPTVDAWADTLEERQR